MRYNVFSISRLAAVYIVITAVKCKRASFFTVVDAFAVSTHTPSGPIPLQRRILAYGDSLTAGTSPPDYKLHPYTTELESILSKPPVTFQIVVRHKGLPGWTASQMLDYANADGGLGTIIESVQNPTLSIVILLAGSNDLAFTAHADTIASSIIGMHKICHSRGVPHTIAVGIPPSGYQASCKDIGDMAQNINYTLAAYCRQNSNRMTYVPFPFDFVRGDDKWCSDGLHFTGKGYRALAECLVPIVSNLLSAKLTD